jgi:hypothetical protein
MKKLIALSASLVLLFCCHAQKNIRTYEDYMQKSQKRMTGGWIFMASGVGLTVLGRIILACGIRDGNGDYNGYYDTRYEEKIISGAALLVTGVALIGVSVPFFIMSNRYKQKAMALAFKAEKIQAPV